MKALGKTPIDPCTVQGLGYLTLALVLGILVARASLGATGGEFVPPLDDTYIYLQYAQGAAQGHFFEYQPGADPTRGATSLLYPLLIAPFARWLAPEQVMWGVWALGVLFLAGTALAAHRWGARRLDERAGAVAGLLTILSGHYVWGVFSGMEIGLFGLALTAGLAAIPWYLEAPDPRSGLRRLAVLGGWLVLLGLARPEGVALGLVMALSVPLAGAAPNSRRARWALVLAPLTVGALHLGVNLMTRGVPGTNTVEAKAIWEEPRPRIRDALFARLPWVAREILWVSFTDFRSGVLGLGTSWVLRGLLVAGGVLGVLQALFRRRGTAPERVLVATLASGLALGMISTFFSVHHNRYQIPYVPLVALLVVSGWWRLLGGRRRRWPAGIVGLLLVAGFLPGLAREITLYGRNAGNIHDQQVALGRWIDANLPSDARVALNDAGAITYYGRREVIDLVGLVTNGSAIPMRGGQGTLFEWMEDLPPDARPTHFAVFPAWYPYLRSTSLMRNKLAQFNLGSNTISGGDVKAVYAADWRNADRGRDLHQRRMLVDVWEFTVSDQLDVGSLRSHRVHHWESLGDWDSLLREFPVADNPGITLLDGGLKLRTGERFTLRCRPGLPGVLVMRTEAYYPFTMDVRVNGISAGRWRADLRPLEWTELVLDLPGDLFTSDAATFEISATDSVGYVPYQYWLLQ